MSTMVTEERMTAAEFLEKYGHCSGVELVRGRVVWAGKSDPTAIRGGRMPHFEHGVICRRVSKRIGDFIEGNDLGWVAVNDTFVPIQADEDGGETVRGADVLYVSYERLPPGPTPPTLTIVPDLVVEVRSPSDRLSQLLAKVGEYIESGVRVVVVVDPRTVTVVVHRPDAAEQVFRIDDEFTLPDVLPGFAVPVRAFFG